ncbi:hypothetical protein K6025_03170 [Ehrlichia sp. JZT12]
MKFNKKLIIIPSIILVSLSSLYVGVWLVIATQVKSIISKSFVYANIKYEDDIQITGFPFTPKVKVSNIKINPSSLNIIIPSLSIRYNLLSNILEMSGSDLTLKLESSIKITKDQLTSVLQCKLNDKFKLLVKLSENLLLSLLKNKREKKAYFTSLVYEDNGISCNNNSNIVKKSLFSIETNELQSPDNLLTKLQYKINAEIMSDVTDTNLKVKNTLMTLVTSDIDFKQIDVDVENINLKLKDSLISAYGKLSLPFSIDNKLNDEALIIEISNYKNAIKQLVELFYYKSKQRDKIYYALQEYIYTISQKKDNGNIVLSINEKFNPFNLFIEQISYKDFVNKVKDITSIIENREVKK